MSLQENTRRSVRCGLAIGVLVIVWSIGACGSSPTPPAESGSSSVSAAAGPDWGRLEQRTDSRIGVYVLDTGNGATVGHRTDERYPMLSTFKVLAVATLLREHPLSTGYFDETDRITGAEIVSNSPITSTRVGTSMSVAELARAALQHSDNTAGNLLLDRLGGPSALTAFVRSLGDQVTRLDRREPDLNTAIPGDPRDTSTPAAEVSDLQTLMLGRSGKPAALAGPERAQLIEWMKGNTTGAAKIRAALPGWTVADKTGGGDYGSVDDVAIAWPPGGGAPLVVAVLTVRTDGPDAVAEGSLIADVTREAVGALRPATG